MRPRFPDRFKYMVLDVQDNEEQNLIRLFPQYAPHLRIGSTYNRVIIERTSSLTRRWRKTDVYWCTAMVSPP